MLEDLKTDIDTMMIIHGSIKSDLKEIEIKIREKAKKILTNKEIPFLTRFNIHESLPENSLTNKRYIPSEVNYPKTNKVLKLYRKDHYYRHERNTLTCLIYEARYILRKLKEHGLDEHLTEEEFNDFALKTNLYHFKISYVQFKDFLEAGEEWFEKMLGSFIYNWE